jgi:hypothetical protein
MRAFIFTYIYKDFPIGFSFLVAALEIFFSILPYL